MVVYSGIANMFSERIIFLSFLALLFIGTRVECGHVQEICGKGQPGRQENICTIRIPIKASFLIVLITGSEGTHFSDMHCDRRSSKILIEFVTPCLEIKIVLARLQPRLTDRFSH